MDPRHGPISFLSFLQTIFVISKRFLSSCTLEDWEGNFDYLREGSLYYCYYMTGKKHTEQLTMDEAINMRFRCCFSYLHYLFFQFKLWLLLRITAKEISF